MKKLYTTPKALVVSDFKNSCSLYRLFFIKALSLVSVIIFLSNISPASANTQSFNNISNDLSGGTNVLKAIPSSYTMSSKVYRESGSALMGGEDSRKNLRFNIKLQIKVAFDTAFAGREGSKNVEDAFFGINSAFTSLNPQLVEIREPLAIGEKQNNLSQYNDQHENIDSFPFLRSLSRSLGRADEGGTITISANSPLTKISFMNSKGEARTLLDVAAGSIAADSTDVVNGSQLYALGNSVAKSLGGNTSYENGKWTAPSFKVKGVDYNGDVTTSIYDNVSAAFAGVGDSFENVKNEIAKEIAGERSDSLNWSKEDRAFVAQHGENKSSSKLTSLLDGTINNNSTDAVTGKQLHILGNSIAKSLGGNTSYENGTWITPTFTFEGLNSNGDIATATYDNVAAAFSGVGNSFTNVKNEITNQIMHAKNDSLLWSESVHAFVASHSDIPGQIPADGSYNKIKYLQDGDISVYSHDAINGSQLYSFGDSVAKYFGGGA
ncbi:hypothetical protein ME1_01487, partial [Bartonella vinsonii subsp. arupensis OK-94-513]